MPIGLEIVRTDDEAPIPEVRQIAKMVIGYSTNSGVEEVEFGRSNTKEGCFALEQSPELIVGHALFREGYRSLLGICDMTRLIPRTLDLHSFAHSALNAVHVKPFSDRPSLALDQLAAANLEGALPESNVATCLALYEQIKSSGRIKVGKHDFELGWNLQDLIDGKTRQADAANWSVMVMANVGQYSALSRLVADQKNRLLDLIHREYLFRHVQPAPATADDVRPLGSAVPWDGVARRIQ